MNLVLLLELLGLLHAALFVRGTRLVHGVQHAQNVGSESKLFLEHQHQLNATEGARLGLKPQPLIVNRADMPLAVYLERGILFNRQVIQPGEAVMLWTPDYGPSIMPFSIVALVGDEHSLPSKMDSLLNFAGMAAVPTAFIGATVVSVVSWGTLSGPALAH